MKKVTAVMYCKFNNNSKRGSLLYLNKDGAIVISKSFKEVLNDVTEANNTTPCIEKGVTVAESDVEVTLLWEEQLRKNKLRINGGK